MDKDDEHSPSKFYYPEDLETFDVETENGITECHIINNLLTDLARAVLGNISCGYTCLLPKVTLWVIALGWDRFGFPVRFSPPVTLQIITQGQLLTWQYLAGNLIHHGDGKPRNIRLACGRSSASNTAMPGQFSYRKLRVTKNA